VGDGDGCAATGEDVDAASSVETVASPLLLPSVIDQTLPQRNARLLAWLAAGVMPPGPGRIPPTALSRSC